MVQWLHKSNFKAQNNILQNIFMKLIFWEALDKYWGALLFPSTLDEK